MMEQREVAEWRVVEHSWARTSIYCGKAQICSLSIEETATEGNQEDLVLEMAKHARLIADAPELLEALRKMDSVMEMLWKAVPWGKTFNLDAAMLNEYPLAAKRAIAKVEGGKP